jgi:hypothetical protein
MHPEAQAKAFEEIDRVIGHDRLPTLADLDNLPYIEALVKETFRWSPPLPISESLVHQVHARILIKIYLVVTPHLTTEDTVYDDYFIPKGSMLLTNIKYEKLSPSVQFHLIPFPQGLCFETSVSGKIQQNSSQKGSYKVSRTDRLTLNL